MGDSRSEIGRVKGKVLEIARELDRLALRSAGGLASYPGSEPGRRVTAKAWLRANDARRRCFSNGASLFVDPAWEMLLTLYIEEHDGRPVLVDQMCSILQLPATTGLRWIDRLVAEGLVQCAGDDAHGARIGLTGGGRARLENALDQAIEGDRKLGLGRLECLQ